jgi:hypothetical protein
MSALVLRACRTSRLTDFVALALVTYFASTIRPTVVFVLLFLSLVMAVSRFRKRRGLKELENSFRWFDLLVRVVICLTVVLGALTYSERTDVSWGLAFGGLQINGRSLQQLGVLRSFPEGAEVVSSLVERYNGPKECLEIETRADVPSGDAMAWWLNLKAICESEIEMFADDLTRRMVVESLRSSEYLPHLLRSWSASFSSNITDSGSIDLGPSFLFNFTTGPYRGSFPALIVMVALFALTGNLSHARGTWSRFRTLSVLGAALLLASVVSTFTLTILSPLDTGRIVFHNGIFLMLSFVLFSSVIVDSVLERVRCSG